MATQVYYNYTPISLPPTAVSTVPSNYILGSSLAGINDSGDIVGNFSGKFNLYLAPDVVGEYTGNGNFLYNNGIYTAYLADATMVGGARPILLYREFTDINNLGQTSAYASFKGYTVSAESGINDAGQTVTGTDRDINNKGEIIGFTRDEFEIAHSYLKSDGVNYEISKPNAISTEAIKINDLGQIVGNYTDATGTHGFISTAGDFKKLTLPDGTDISPAGINNLGQIVGNSAHGSFLLTPTPPGAPKMLVLRVAEDAYKGDAQFIVKVNGQQVGDVQTVHASHAAGQWDTITLQSTIPDPTQVQIQFINDLYEWSPSADRNLYVQSLTFDGRTFDAKAATNTAGYTVTDGAALLGNGSLTFQHVQDTLKLRVAEDNYMGDAKFIVTVDGVQVGGVQTAHASHANGQWEDVTLTGDFAHANRVGVQFINDVNAGPGQDRNLYVDSINLNGTTYKGSDASVPHGLGQTTYSAELWTNASAVFSTGPDSLVFRVAEDAYKGDARFIVKVDGQQVGGIQTAHASHANGQWEDITLHGSFAGANHVSVEFINDANGGAGQDRNLYIDSISLDGQIIHGRDATVAKGIGQTVYSAELWTNGSADFNVSGLHHTDLMA